MNFGQQFMNIFLNTAWSLREGEKTWVSYATSAYSSHSQSKVLSSLTLPGVWQCHPETVCLWVASWRPRQRAANDTLASKGWPDTPLPCMQTVPNVLGGREWEWWPESATFGHSAWWPTPFKQDIETDNYNVLVCCTGLENMFWCHVCVCLCVCMCMHACTLLDHAGRT